ncbi:hypothetical protein [Micromonospora saelicesensis]|uniref:hypothetical protein n=1 Tax=Micromonospora saelicesensis TaxID=285676 RepID=UPI0015EC7B4C|nr:hypothetical protein [Micromonospora saelicesensis]
MLTIDRVSSGRALVSDELFAQLTARIARDHPELAPTCRPGSWTRRSPFSPPAPPPPSRSARATW